MLEALMSMPVSIGLLIWISRMKKNDPFPKFTFARLLIFGVISLLVSAVISLIGSMIVILIQIGPEQLGMLMNAETAAQVIQGINDASNEMTVSSLLIRFARTFVLIGLAEEVLKFLCAKTGMRREGTVHTWKDALLCFAVVAVGFQIAEDIMYSSGSMGIAIYRALTPFHFTFAVIMGYIWGLGKVKGNRFYTVMALVIPALIHALYDFSVNLLRRSDDYAVFALAMSLFMFILTVVMILKLRKWNRDGSLDIYI